MPPSHDLRTVPIEELNLSKANARYWMEQAKQARLERDLLSAQIEEMDKNYCVRLGLRVIAEGNGQPKDSTKSVE